MEFEHSLSVMMPAFNEESTVELILEHVLQRPEVGEVIVVDDGSTDKTWEVMSRIAAQDKRVQAFQQNVSEGKGPQLRLPVSHPTRPFAPLQDPDVEYTHGDHPALH